jgi:hypothetical protein
LLFYVLLCYVMLCYVMLCYVMLCYVMLCYVMLCYVMLCYVMLLLRVQTNRSYYVTLFDIHSVCIFFRLQPALAYDEVPNQATDRPAGSGHSFNTAVSYRS